MSESESEGTSALEVKEEYIWTTVDCPCVKNEIKDCKFCGNRRRIPEWIPKKVQK